MFICPECRSVYSTKIAICERDQEQTIPVQANQNPRTYPLLNHELDGRYHLIGGLGQGGVGTVYLANHIHLDQLSAVKFLDIDLLGQADEEQKTESLQDFVKEAKLAMLLRHDAVVRVMDYGVYETSPFLVMEYIPGPSLLRRMNAGERFSIDQCLNIIRRLAEALNAFHERRLVHRDLKPANVILDPRDNGHLTLVDLGLVKDLSSEARSSTHPLALRGTPGYLAPEQVPSWVLSSAGAVASSEKQPVDARVDIFALGVLAYEILTGQPPYPKGLSPTKVIIYTCTQTPASVESLCPEIVDYPGLAELVKSMMAKRPQERPLNGREVIERVDEITQDLKDVGNPRAIREEIHRAQNVLMKRVLTHSNPNPPPSNSLNSQLSTYPSPQDGAHSPSVSHLSQVSLIPSPRSMRSKTIDNSQTTNPLSTHQERDDGSTITGEVEEKLHTVHEQKESHPQHHLSPSGSHRFSSTPPGILPKSLTPPPLKSTSTSSQENAHPSPSAHPYGSKQSSFTNTMDEEDEPFGDDHTEIYLDRSSAFGRDDDKTMTPDLTSIAYTKPPSFQDKQRGVPNSVPNNKPSPLLLFGGVCVLLLGLFFIFKSENKPQKTLYLGTQKSTQSKNMKSRPTNVSRANNTPKPSVNQPLILGEQQVKSSKTFTARTSKSFQLPTPVASPPSRTVNTLPKTKTKVVSSSSKNTTTSSSSPPSFNTKKQRRENTNKTTKDRVTQNQRSRVPRNKKSNYTRKKQPKSNTSSSSKSSKPFVLTQRKYNVLKFQVDSLISNNRQEIAKQKLKRIIKQLKPGDPYYLEVVSLFDGFDP